jgi:PhnB protein
MQTTLVPYLNFMGQTKEAMEFYHAIFGGELKMQTFAESGMPTTEENKNNVIHAELKTEWMTIMCSDGDETHPVEMGNNIHLSLIGTDEAKLTEFFNKLSEGGKVDLELKKQFWGDTYGQLTDKFGLHWSVNIGPAQPPAAK